MQPFALVAAQSGGGGSIGLFLPLLLLAAFYVFAVRPQRRRQREFAQIQAGLAEGQEIMTTAGLFGTVSEIGPDFVLVEVAPGVRVKLARAAIARVVPVREPAPDVPPDDRA